ncbi:DMT family transporter [Clostridium estertheticum]|uniref:DMT family transporter n=1 Tax=Clostridium estertheticum TaxID=238834 RepID=UPI001CF5F6A2|nr:DMT family transporter [Clostridium estertheticum]MCB2305514.1 DMT family transporter [Clostridium estertheticum]MCB2343953.1 DMT family transporter [Clostridium estertheticum]MCB2348869.1 DMT family transporter [Clostridium estertheticum]WAG46189.1 DMT family transporter [Clostridium estertheticum]
MRNKSIFTNKKVVAIIATFCCFLWGSAFPAIKNGYIMFNISASDIPSKLVFAGYRFIIAGLVLLVIAKSCGKKIFNISKKNALDLSCLGVIQTTLQYIFFYIGVSNTTGVKGSIMNSTVTFFSVILAHYIYANDKLSMQKILGCIVGFIGVMSMNFSADLLDFSFRFSGEGFLMIAAFVSAVGAIYGKKLTKSMDVMVVTGYSLFVGGIMLMLIGMLSGGSVYHFTMDSSLLLMYLALLSSAAFSLWNLLLKYNKVGPVSIFNFLIPIFGSILSAIFLNENIFECKNIFALVLVCLGIWMVNKEKVTTK